MNKIAIGIDVGGTNLTGGLVSSDLKIQERISLPTPKNFDDLKAAIDKICWELNSNFDRQLPRGIALPGLIDKKEEKVFVSPNMKFLNDQKLADISREGIFGNDVDLALSGEIETDKELKKQNVLLLNIGTGVGGSVSLQGQGSWKLNIPTEIGHVVAMPGGRLCGCGNRGCLEAYFSGTAFLREAKEKISRSIDSTEELFDLTREGNEQAEKIINEGVVALGVSLASMVNLFDLDLILIGGKIGLSFDLFSRKTYLIAKQHLFSRKDFTIRKTNLIDQGAIIGAAISALKG